MAAFLEGLRNIREMQREKDLSENQLSASTIADKRNLS